MSAVKGGPNSNAQSSFWDDVRPFCCLVVIGLLCLSVFSAVQVYTIRTAVPRSSSGTATAVLSVAWLYFAFPLGVICLVLQFAAPGCGRRLHWLPVSLAALFVLSTLGWLVFGSWWYHEAGHISDFFNSLWWLKPVAWLWN